MALLALWAIDAGARGVRRRATTIVGRTKHPADREGSEPPEPSPDIAVVLRLLDAALATGASVPRAIEIVGGAIGGVLGRALTTVAATLLLGASWGEAWQAGTVEDRPSRRRRSDSTRADLRVVADALEASWTEGLAARPLVRRAAEVTVRDRRRQLATAARRLEVRLIVPLGLCFLPSFVLIAVVPVLLALGTSVW